MTKVYIHIYAGPYSERRWYIYHAPAHPQQQPDEGCQVKAVRRRLSDKDHSKGNLVCIVLVLGSESTKSAGLRGVA